MKLTRATPLAATLALLVTFAGCLDTAQEGCTSSGPTDFAGQQLTILDHGAFDFMFATIEPLFENQTGADLVQLVGDDAGGALRLAIDSRGNPVADILYGVDNALFLEGALAGIFEPYASPGLVRLDTRVIDLDAFRYQGVLLATPADHGYISANYDIRLTETHDADDLPRALGDLARPEWASEFVTSDPRFSSPGLGFLIATVATFGEDDDYDYLDYWKDLLEGGALVVGDWTTAYVFHYTGGYGQYEAGHIGDRSIVMSYTTSPAVEVFFGAESVPGVSVEPPKGVFHQVETVAILRCTDQLPLAQAFVDFVLGDDFQDAVAPNMAVYPVGRDAAVPAEFDAHATAPSDLIAAPFTPQDLRAGIPRWLDAWTDLFLAESA